MFIDVNYNKRKKGYKIYLAKPNKQIIAILSEAYSPEYSVKLSNLSELTFRVPYYIDKHDERIENDNIEKIREKMYLKIEYNNQEEWLIIDELKDVGEGSSKYLNVTSFTNVYENTHKRITELNLDTVNPNQYYEAILNDSSWTLGEVDASFEDMYRSFELSGTTILEAILTGAETYGAVLEFDTQNKRLYMRDIEERAQYRGLKINYRNLLQSVERTRNVDEMVTRLYVYGDEGVSINNVNPTGLPYLEDYSYFLHPFERDENKNVIQSSHYMSDELAHALLDLEELTREYLPTIEEIQEEIDVENTELVNEEVNLSNLRFDLTTAKGLLDIAKATGDKELESQRQEEVDRATRLVEDKEILVQTIKDNLENLNNQIQGLQDSISVTSFSGELLDELNPYIIEKEFRDDRYIDEQELYEDALKHFEEFRKPNVVVEASIDNIIDSLEEEYYSDKIVLGDIARIADKDMRVDMKSLIMEMSFELDSGTCTLTVANNDIEKDGTDKILSILYDTQSATTMLERNKEKWNSVTDVKTEVDLLRDGEIDATRNRIRAGVNESVEIADRGIILSNPDFPDEIVIMQAGVIALSTDGGENWSTSITPRGVMADTIIGRLVAGNNLLITNDEGTFRIDSDGLTVDMDSISITSGEGETPENMVDSWNRMLITMDEFANDNILNPYEKNQIARQWNAIAIAHSSMVDTMQEAYGPETEDNPYPLEYDRYIEAYERLNEFLNEEVQSDGHTILDELNRDETTEIDGERYNEIVTDYEIKKDEFQTVIPLEFSQTAIEQTRKEISLNYVKNGEVATQLNLSEEGVRIDGRLLEINSETQFNDDLVMNAGVIRSRDSGIVIDLNEGTMNLSRPLMINAVPVATQEYVNQSVSDVIQDIDTEYAISDSATEAPTGVDDWRTQAPPWEEGKYIWSRTITTYKNGETEITTPVNITGARGREGRSVSSINEQYYLSTSPTDLENGSWVDTPPSWEPDKYMWTRNVITYANPYEIFRTEPISISGAQGPKGEDGDDAPLVRLHGATQIIKQSERGYVTPSTPFNVVAISEHTSITSFDYSIDGGSFTGASPTGVTRDSLTITIDPTRVTFDTLTIRATDGEISDTFTIARAVDGTSGEDAYTVLLTNEAHTFVGDTRNAVNGSTTTDILAYKGGVRVPVAITDITDLPAGMTTTISNNGTVDARVTITVAEELNKESGIIGINMSINDEDIVKHFSYSLAYKGEKGDDGLDAVTAYLTNDTHFIPTNSEGEDGDYRNAFTDIHIMQGGRDVTSEYEITVEEETNVVGNLEDNRYTVTQLDGDHEEIVIRATKDDIIIEKVFTVAKSKQGVKGIDPTVYKMNSSSLVMVRNIDDIYSPEAVTFTGYSKKGVDDYRPYEGYFVIYEKSGQALTVDEFTERAERSQVTDSEYILSNEETPLTLRYLSGYAESEVEYTPSGGILGLYVEFYADEELTRVLDSQTVMVVEDAKPSYKAEWFSTNGTQAVNGELDTTLYARLYRGAEDITDQTDSRHFDWIRISRDPEADVEWNEAHKGTKEVHINSDVVDVRATYRVIVHGLS